MVVKAFEPHSCKTDINSQVRRPGSEDAKRNGFFSSHAITAPALVPVVREVLLSNRNVQPEGVIGVLAPFLKTQPDRAFASKVLRMTKEICFGSHTGEIDSATLEGYVLRLREGGDFARIHLGTHEDVKRVILSIPT